MAMVLPSKESFSTAMYMNCKSAASRSTNLRLGEHLQHLGILSSGRRGKGRRGGISNRLDCLKPFFKGPLPHTIFVHLRAPQAVSCGTAFGLDDSRRFARCASRPGPVSPRPLSSHSTLSYAATRQPAARMTSLAAFSSPDASATCPPARSMCSWRSAQQGLRLLPDGGVDLDPGRLFAVESGHPV